MLNFNDEFLTFERNGTKHEVKKPSQEEINEYNANLERAKKLKKTSEDILLDLIEKMGLSRDIYSSLNNSQAKTLVKELFDSEKN